MELLIFSAAFGYNGYNYYNGTNCGNNATSPMYLMPYPCYSYDYVMPSPPDSPPSVGEDSIASNTNESNANHTSNNINSSENVS